MQETITYIYQASYIHSRFTKKFKIEHSLELILLDGRGTLNLYEVNQRLIIYIVDAFISYKFV